MRLDSPAYRRSTVCSIETYLGLQTGEEGGGGRPRPQPIPQRHFISQYFCLIPNFNNGRVPHHHPRHSERRHSERRHHYHG